MSNWALSTGRMRAQMRSCFGRICKAEGVIKKCEDQFACCLPCNLFPHLYLPIRYLQIIWPLYSQLRQFTFPDIPSSPPLRWTWSAELRAGFCSHFSGYIIVSTAGPVYIEENNMLVKQLQSVTKEIKDWQTRIAQWFILAPE